jgi:hypothetical protein
MSPRVPDLNPKPEPDGKARRFGRAVIILGAVVAVILIALFVSPKSESPLPYKTGGAGAR